MGLVERGHRHVAIEERRGGAIGEAVIGGLSRLRCPGFWVFANDVVACLECVDGYRGHVRDIAAQFAPDLQSRVDRASEWYSAGQYLMYVLLIMKPSWLPNSPPKGRRERLLRDEFGRSPDLLRKSGQVRSIPRLPASPRRRHSGPRWRRRIPSIHSIPRYGFARQRCKRPQCRRHG